MISNEVTPKDRRLAFALFRLAINLGMSIGPALGGFLALSPMLAGAILLSWIIVFKISRISSLSAIIAASLGPVYSIWLIDSVNARWIVLVIAIMLVARHHGNIKRLLAGEESKSGTK